MGISELPGDEKLTSQDLAFFGERRTISMKP